MIKELLSSSIDTDIFTSTRFVRELDRFIEFHARNVRVILLTIPHSLFPISIATIVQTIKVRLIRSEASSALLCSRMTSNQETPIAAIATSEKKDAHTFYNNAPAHDLKRRDQSQVLSLRNFNNWIKSTLISELSPFPSLKGSVTVLCYFFIDEYLNRLRTEQPDRKNEIHVFDMGCGKGERLSTSSPILWEKNSLRWFLGGDQLKWHIGNVKHVTFAGE